MGANIPLPALDVRVPQQQDPVENYVKLKSLLGNQQLQQQQIQAGQLENQQRTNDLQSQQAIKDAYTEAGGDLKKTVMLAAKKGARPADLIKLQQASIEQQKQNLDLLNAKGARAIQEADLMQGAHDQLAKLPPDQRAAAYPQAIQSLGNAGVDVSQMSPQYPGDEAFNLGGVALKGHKAQLEELAKQEDIRKTGAQADEAAAAVPGKVAESQSKALTLAGTNAQGMTASQQAEATARQQTLGMEAAKFSETKRHNMATEGQLTPEALTASAQQFATTGQMPQVGRSGAVRSQIINEASRLYPNLDIAANSGAYKANQDSLKSLQKNFDQVTAFENTAGKNLDVFLNTAKSVVDSGSPLVNAPLRMVNDRIAGSDKQAAFAAARTTALTEIAKVLNSSNANGVLSDSARNEVEQLVGKDATLKQIYSAATILKQDMENRRQSYQDQIGAIQQRIKAPKSGAQQTAPTQAAPAGATGIAPGSDGKRHYHDAKGNDLGIAP